MTSQAARQLARRYVYSGHVVGAAAQFTRVDDTSNLNYTVPALGASALPETGGVSENQISKYSLTVDQPRQANLFSVESLRTRASGAKNGAQYETDIEADIQNVTVGEQLNIGRLYMHFLASRDSLNEDSDPVVSTKGCLFEGLMLGQVEAIVTVADEPIRYSGTKTQLADYYRTLTPEYRRKYSWRFGTDPDATEIAEYRGCCRWSMVSEIKLSGPETALQDITVDGYTIIWNGFGKIILGEYLVKGQHRRLSMVRLAMGSPIEGDGSVGEGESNGQVGP